MRTVMISICFILLGSASASDLLSQSTSDEDQILRLEEDWGKALKNEDRPALERILSPELTFIEADGSVINRDEYLADRSNNPYDIDSIEFADMKVRVFGNSALVTGRTTVTEHRANTQYHYQLRWKEFWLKGPSGWQVLAGQATPINPKWNDPFIVR